MSRPACPAPRLLALIALLCGFAHQAVAQFASNIRLTNPVGRSVLEIRKGTQPANPRLLFTAVITAGPTGGTTSVLLQQAFLRDIFNPVVPAAGWTTVLSTGSAFSLGGGCGRNNLIDFPFINNNRPVILRITGTTQQVITLGIAGNDLYDSIDCVTQADGRVLYMLSNRTRQRLEFRREQGGLMVLVRDNFGTVITPFVGGLRPSLTRFRRPINPIAPTSQGPVDLQGGLGPLRDEFVAFFVVTLLPNQQIVKLMSILDDDTLTELGSCNGPSSPAPTGFNGPKESAVTVGVAVGPSRNDNVLWGDYFFVDNGGCTKIQPPESFGSTGPFGLYTWAGLAANNVSANTAGGAGGGAVFPHTTLILPNSVITFEGNDRRTQASPFAGRGGPVTACPLLGSEIDAAQLGIGVGPSNLQVQHSIVSNNLAETVSNSSFEDVWESTTRCE